MAELAEGALLGLGEVLVISGSAATDMDRVAVRKCRSRSGDALIATCLDAAVTADDVVVTNSGPSASAMHRIDFFCAGVKDTEPLVVRGARVNDNAVHYPLWLCSGAGHLLVQTRGANTLGLKPRAHSGAKPVQKIEEGHRLLTKVNRNGLVWHTIT